MKRKNSRDQKRGCERRPENAQKMGETLSEGFMNHDEKFDFLFRNLRRDKKDEDENDENEDNRNSRRRVKEGDKRLNDMIKSELGTLRKEKDSFGVSICDKREIKDEKR